MKPNTHRRTAVDDAAELARQMPAPAVPGLPADRRLMLREQLMQHLQEPSGTGTPAPRPHRRTRRRMLWGLAPLTAVAAALVAVLAVGGFTGGGSGSAGPGRTSGAGPAGAAGPLLERLALAAEQQPAAGVRDDQYVYIKSLVAFAEVRVDGSGHGTMTLDTPHERQVWLSVDGTKAGQLTEKGGTEPLEPNSSPYLNGPTYRYLESLPTDPDALLAKIYAETAGAGSSREQEAFTTIGDLLRESIAPPKVTAALYRAAAKIPGVVEVKDVADAAGRHGVAVARTDEANGEQQEWIFDNATSTFLGERDVQVTQSKAIAPGTVTGEAAIVQRAIVDSPGKTG